jgi:hypothetical protein
MHSTPFPRGGASCCHRQARRRNSIVWSFTYLPLSDRPYSPTVADQLNPRRWRWRNHDHTAVVPPPSAAPRLHACSLLVPQGDPLNLLMYMLRCCCSAELLINWTRFYVRTTLLWILFKTIRWDTVKIQATFGSIPIELARFHVRIILSFCDLRLKLFHILCSRFFYVWYCHRTIYNDSTNAKILALEQKKFEPFQNLNTHSQNHGPATGNAQYQISS